MQAMQGVRARLLQRTFSQSSGSEGALSFVGEEAPPAQGKVLVGKMDHLVCFLPGDRGLLAVITAP